MAGIILTTSWLHTSHHQPLQWLPVHQRQRGEGDAHNKPREKQDRVVVRTVTPRTTDPPTQASVDPAEFVELQKKLNDSIDQQLLDSAYRYYLAEAAIKDDNIDPNPKPKKRQRVKVKPLQLSDLVERFPTFMIIGFGKAGTKALFEALKLHPSLAGPYKERRFFSTQYSSDIASYLSSIPEPPPGGFTIEKSPDYIIHSQAPARIVADANKLGVAPSVLKFIVVLRNPIDRAVSEYIEWNLQRQNTRKKALPPFHKMVLLKNKIDGKQPFLNASCYAYHISKWMKVFPKEQLCFVDGDKFVTDPYSEVHRLEECMGLPQFFTDKNFVYVIERGFYCFQSSETKICMNKSKGRKHPDIPADVVEKLKDYFRPWNDQLPDMTGRQFIDWETQQDT